MTFSTVRYTRRRRLIRQSRQSRFTLLSRFDAQRALVPDHNYVILPMDSDENMSRLRHLSIDAEKRMERH
jgi:hypothetical protein